MKRFAVISIAKRSTFRTKKEAEQYATKLVRSNYQNRYGLTELDVVEHVSKVRVSGPPVEVVEVLEEEET